MELLGLELRVEVAGGQVKGCRVEAGVRLKAWAVEGVIGGDVRRGVVSGWG